MKVQTIKCEKSGKTIKIAALNARTIKITPLSKLAEIRENGELVGLDYDDEFGVKPNSVFTLNKHKYKINRVSKVTNSKQYAGPGYYLHIAELNKSAMFIMPLLGQNREYFRWDKEFVNCFMGTEDEGCINTIRLWYRYPGTVEMEKFEQKLMKHTNYMGQENVDKYHVMYEFSVSMSDMPDYHKLVGGKYSRITDESKERILEFHGSSNGSPLGKILNRDPTRRKKMEKDLDVKIDKDAELHDPFYEEDELFQNSYRIEDSVM